MFHFNLKETVKLTFVTQDFFVFSNALKKLR